MPLAVQTRAVRDREDHLYTAFQYFDKDSSGYITKEELEQALKNYGWILLQRFI
jgi:Ca2+-binding EF-hand superfamily protein